MRTAVPTALLASAIAVLALGAPARAQVAAAAEGSATAGAPAAAEPAAEAGEEEAVARREPAGADETPATEAPATAGPAPKIAIVLSGDPEPALVEAANRLAAALEAEAGVRLPADPALRAALLGQGTDDGLDDVRAARRRLGRSERADLPVLAELGGIVRAVLLLEVRASADDTPEAVAFDVGQQAFFDGVLDLSAGVPASAGRFATRRARAAAEAVAEGAEPVDEGASEEAASRPSPASSPSGEGDAAEPSGDPTLQWLEQNWAYLAAGVLLAGGIAFVVVVATEPGPTPPTLTFSVGAD